MSHYHCRYHYHYCHYHYHYHCQEYTQSGGVRPFGVSLLICGWDEPGKPLLFQCDPSGAYFAWKATAMGKNNINGKTFLEKR